MLVHIIPKYFIFSQLKICFFHLLTFLFSFINFTPPFVCSASSFSISFKAASKINTRSSSKALNFFFFKKILIPPSSFIVSYNSIQYFKNQNKQERRQWQPCITIFCFFIPKFKNISLVIFSLGISLCLIAFQKIR